MPTLPLHLCIESSGHAVSLAVGDANAPAARAAVALPRQRRGQLDLMPRAAELIAGLGAGPRDLAAISLSLGPGSFTGLRVAVATAKMLAFTLKVKLVGIPTLDVLRAQHPHAIIALNVKRDTAWSAGPDLEPAMRPLETLRAACRAADRALIGDLDDATAPAEADVAVLYRLAHARIMAHDYDDPLVLAPAYIREPEAVVLWDEREHARTS